jgi:hypothetical protein
MVLLPGLTVTVRATVFIVPNRCIDGFNIFSKI